MGGRALNKLSAVEAAKLKASGRHSDGGGLYLSIDDSGRRRWVFMYVRGGKRTEMGLGGGRDLPLAKARKEAEALREVLASGGDPKAERDKEDRTVTFGECADAYVEAMAPSWRNAKHAAQWKMTLTDYAKPIRGKPVNDVTTQDVLDVLKPLWTRTPETAERLRGRIENVLDAAKAQGLRSGENPARWRGHLKQLLPPRRRLSRGHHVAAAYDGLPAFMSEVQAREAVAARALEFTILTAARSGEVLGAKWSEIDLAKKVWTVPAPRMKAGVEHRVPLSGRAIEILTVISGAGVEDDMKAPGDVFVFPGPETGRPLSGMAMAMLLRRMQSQVTVHGFRSSFRDWASEATGFPHEVCEMALAHTISNRSEAAYRRGDLFEKRRKLMEAWAAYCGTAKSDKVVPLRSRPAA